MTTRMIVGRAAAVAALISWGVPGVVNADPDPVNAVPAPPAKVWAIPVGPQEAVPGPGEGEPVRMALPPPMDQIPPMPMPVDGVDVPPGSDTVLFHDAARRTTVELPARPPSGAVGGGGSGFVGADGVVMAREWVRSLGAMTAVTSFNAFPDRTSCKLAMRFVDLNGATRWFSCSGAMQDSGVVLTAAHCVYARDVDGTDIYDWAREVWVYPGWDGVDNGGNSPFSTDVINNWGYTSCSEFIAGTDWVNNGNFNRDCAAIRIIRGQRRSVGMLTGWLGRAWGYSCGENLGRQYYNFSYPAEPCGSGGLHTGRTLYFRSGTFDLCVGNRLQTNTASGCLNAVWGGMSGSNAYFFANATDRWAHAVCSTSDRATYGRYCKLWEQFDSDLNSFRSGARGTTFDLEALQFRLNGSTTVQASATTSGCGFVAANATNADPPMRTYTVRVYLSTNREITTADTLVGTFTFDYDFAPMQALGVGLPGVVIPASTAAGTRYLGVVLDPATDAVPENNDTLAWDVQAVQVTPGPPPPPSNNTCATAFNLSIGATVVGPTTNATNNGSASCGNSTTSPDVWFRIVPPFSGTLAIDACGSYFDTVLSIHSGCPGDTTNQIRCNDDRVVGGRDSCPNSTASLLTTGVTGGTTYYVRLAGYLGAGGGYTIRTYYQEPLNDDCPSATVYTTGSLVNGTLAGATNDGTTSCGQSAGGADAWYRLTAIQTGSLRFDTCGSGFDTVLSVHTGCPGTIANQIACNDDALVGTCVGTLQSAVDVGVTSGVEYFIRVSGYSGAIGSFTLRSQYLPPANDACASGTPLLAGTSVVGVTATSTNDGGSSCGNTASSPDVWFRLAPSCTGRLRLDTCGSAFDTVLSVHAGCPGTAANEIACNDDHGTGAGGCTGLRDSALDLIVSAGTVYFVRVAGFAGASGAFTISARYIGGRPTDDCESAPVIVDGFYLFTNCGATTDGPQEGLCGFGFGDNQVNNDVWVRYNTPAARFVTVDTCASVAPVFDTKIAVYRSTECPGAENAATACNDDAGPGCGGSLYLSRLTFASPAGGTALIRIGGYLASAGSGTLTISSFCLADFNRDGTVAVQDIFDYLNAWLVLNPLADIDLSGGVAVQDIFDFLNVWLAGCS